MGAGAIDFLLCLPFVVIPYFLSHWSLLKYELWYLPTYLFYPYTVLMISRYGQTLGKMALGIMVVRTDGERAGLRNTLGRAGGDLAIGAILIVDHLVMLNKLGSAAFQGDSYDRIINLVAWGGLLGMWAFFLPAAWYTLEFITMNFNPRRRAIHDYFGGTVVLSTRKSAPSPQGPV